MYELLHYRQQKSEEKELDIPVRRFDLSNGSQEGVAGIRFYDFTKD